MKTERANRTREHLVAVAKELFIEKGFAETSMSDIAVAAGINRPKLHYYFRTKDDMFEAVFADIAHALVPAIHDIVTQQSPIGVRISRIVDIYYATILKEPFLPTFLMREIHRDPDHLIQTVGRIETACYARRIVETLQEQMRQGTIRSMPVPFIFYTFLSLIYFPFITKPLTDRLFTDTESAFPAMLQPWKAHIVRQMMTLLSVAPAEAETARGTDGAEARTSD